VDPSTIAQFLSAATNIIFVVVISIGYYMMVKLYRQMVNIYDRMVRETEAQGTALGRPQVIVDTDYGRLPQVDVVVRNLSQGAAREVSFEFSAPVVSSDGTVISDLSYFKDGLHFMSPGGEISCYWDHLDNLLPLLEEKGLTNGISVTTRYKDLAGRSYETEWNLDPYVYRDDRYVHRTGLSNVVSAIRELSGKQPTGGQEVQESRQG
jgi:hypothetical protein